MNAPILVTGAHRSGTTWVGRMLCASREAGYVHEPFNPNRAPGWFLEPLPYWFMHIDEINSGDYEAAVQRMVSFRYPLLRALARTRSPRVAAMNLQQAAGAGRDRIAGRRLLLKDPLALFSAEWLARSFGMEVVVLVRHPASFISSIKRLNWGFDYERNWLAQPRLMQGLLGGHEETFQGYRGEEDLVAEGIVVWNALYEVVAGYRDRHPGWMVVRYEDIAAEPIPSFKTLYERLGLAWSGAVEERVARFSSTDNPADVEPDDPHEIRRNSRAAAGTWRERLSPSEIERIRSGTQTVWPAFYSDVDWEAQAPSEG